MDNLILYLIKVNAGTVILYLLYKGIFANDTFHMRNRFLLLSILIIPFTIPSLRIYFSGNKENLSVYSSAINGIISTTNRSGTDIISNMNAFNLEYLLLVVYFAVGSFFLAKDLIGILYTHSLIRKSKALSGKFPFIVISESDNPVFSFFPYIYIPSHVYNSNAYEDILEHEKAHVTQVHSLDLMLCEIALSFQWLNPAIWLLKKELRLNHEYLADSATLKSTKNIKAYQYLLLSIPAQYKSKSFTHNFYSSIKNRIVMINKKPTRRIAWLKNLLILPSVAFLLIMFSFRSTNTGNDGAIKQSQFSKTSTEELLKFLAMNAGYPEASKNSLDTGYVFISVKMGKGGIVKECTAIDKNQIRSEILPEMVIVGYKPVSVTKTSPGNHDLLKLECIKNIRKIGSLNIPEWEEKDMEFTLAFKFILK